MTPSIPPDPTARVRGLLEQLAAQKITQSDVARRTGVPPQYLSDVKSGRRALTELFARRLGEEFHVDFEWLLAKSENAPLSRIAAKADAKLAGLTLPLLSEAVTGDPRQSPCWDGGEVCVVGPAAVVASSPNSYVLRVPKPTKCGRLRPGDLVLVSQDAPKTNELAALDGPETMLAWLEESGRWQNAFTGRLIGGKHQVCGRCVGIVWATIARD